jgi:outer membrane protein OmpA-like peptidoglycan-associated protein
MRVVCLFFFGLLLNTGSVAAAVPPLANAYLTLRATDQRTKQPVAAQFRVSGRNTPAFTVQSTLAQPAVRQQLPVPDLLSVEVTATGYTPVTQVLDARRWEDTTEFRLEANLLPLGTSTVLLQAYDADTQRNLFSAGFAVTSPAGDVTYPVRRNAQTGQATAEVPTGNPYVVRLTAPGYQPREARPDPATNGTVVRMGLRPARSAAQSTLVLTAVDRGTGQTVPAQFRVTNAQTRETFSEQTTPDRGLVRRALTTPGVLTIEISSDGFLPLTRSIDARQFLSGENFTVKAELSRTTTNLALTVLDATTRQPLPKAQFRVTSADVANETVPTQPNSAPGTWAATVPTGRRYFVRVEAPGHEPTELTLTAQPGAEAQLVLLQPIVYRLRLHAINDRNGDPVPAARLRLLNSKTGQEIPLEATGEEYVANLPQLTPVRVEAEASGFKPLSETVNPAEWVGRYEFRRDVPMRALTTVAPPRVGQTPVELEAPSAPRPVPVPPSPTRFDNLKKGQTVVLNNLYFDQSSYVLRPESSAELDRLVAALKANPKLKIAIAGHTDNVGDSRLNVLLSENRAKVVKNYLFNRGIADNRLSAIGYGPNRPVAPNDSEEARSRNRRVEFTVVED